MNIFSFEAMKLKIKHRYYQISGDRYRSLVTALEQSRLDAQKKDKHDDKAA